MNTHTESRSAKTEVKMLLTEWIKAEDDGGWVVGVYGLAGCAVQENTEEEAERMIVDAYMGCIESYEAVGEEVPYSYAPRAGWELRWVRF